MNSIFPKFRDTTTGKASAGSIISIARDGGWLGLAVGGPAEDKRDIVILSGTSHWNLPVFGRGWPGSERCLCFESEIEWVVSMTAADVDAEGHNLWRTNGAVVAIDDQLYLRTFSDDRYSARAVLINIITGEIFEGQPSGGTWSTRAWSIVLRGPHVDQRQTLVDFHATIPKQ